MRLRVGTPDHLILSSALCVLQGASRWALPETASALSAEEQDALFAACVASDTVSLLAKGAKLSRVEFAEKLALRLSSADHVAAAALEALRAETGTTIARLREKSAPAMLFKSLDLADNVWPTLPLHTGSADILIHPPQVTVCKTVLRELGYTQSELDRENGRLVEAQIERIQGLEEKAARLFAFRKLIRAPALDHLSAFLRADYLQPDFMLVGDDAYLIAEINVHLTVLTGVDIPDIWERTRTIDLSGDAILAQDPSDMLWTLATGCYHEVMLDVRRPIRSFLDVLAVLTRFSWELDWDRIQLIAKRYGLEPGLYYVLRHAGDLLGASVVPQDRLHSFYPGRSDVVRRRDWGDFVPRLFATDALYVPLSLDTPDSPDDLAVTLNGTAESEPTAPQAPR